MNRLEFEKDSGMEDMPKKRGLDYLVDAYWRSMEMRKRRPGFNAGAQRTISLQECV